MQIERAAVDCDDGKQLIAELWREVDLIYGNREPTVPNVGGNGCAGRGVPDRARTAETRSVVWRCGRSRRRSRK